MSPVAFSASLASARKNALSDVGGQPIIGTDNQPVVAAPGVARVAGQQVAYATMDLPATKAALDAQAGFGWLCVDPYPVPDGNGMTTIPPYQYAAFKAGQPPPVQPLRRCCRATSRQPSRSRRITSSGRRSSNSVTRKAHRRRLFSVERIKTLTNLEQLVELGSNAAAPPG